MIVQNLVILFFKYRSELEPEPEPPLFSRLRLRFFKCFQFVKVYDYNFKVGTEYCFESTHVGSGSELAKYLVRFRNRNTGTEEAKVLKKETSVQLLCVVTVVQVSPENIGFSCFMVAFSFTIFSIGVYCMVQTTSFFRYYASAR